MNTFSMRRTMIAAALIGIATVSTACSNNKSNTDASTADKPSPSTPSMPSMSGMDNEMTAVSGDGLSASEAGYQLTSTATTLPAGRATTYQFMIMGATRAVTAFQVEQTKQMHFYVVRSDLAGFQHVLPTMAVDGTCTARLAALEPGKWRLYAQFTVGTDAKPTTLVLSRSVTVAGMVMSQRLPRAATTTTVDGYSVTVHGMPKAGMATPLTVTFSKNGKPVTDLQPYLDTYAHLTAFHAGDLAFAHLHPMGTVTGKHGGPTLQFNAELPKPGSWRLFLQFQTAGQVHAAAITLTA